MGYLDYCSVCGSKNDAKEIEGALRKICSNCGTIHYENPHPAATVIGIKDDKLLLVRRAIPPAKGQWCLPGGYLELGEVPLEAAKRELEEETGLIADDLQFLGFCPFAGGPQRNVLVMGFVGYGLSGDLIAGDDATDANWFPLNDLPPIAFLCHRDLIRQYLAERNSTS